MPFLPGEDKLVGACTARSVSHYSSSLANITCESGLEDVYPFVDVMFAQGDDPELPIFSGYQLGEYLDILKTDRPIDYAIYLAWIHDAFDSEITGLFDRLMEYEKKHCYSSLEIKIPFQSLLYDAIYRMPLNRASPSQWQSTISNLTSKGIRKEEIEWFGLIDWLKNQHGQISGESILSRINLSPVVIDLGVENECGNILMPDFSEDGGLLDINYGFRIVRRIPGGQARWNWEVRGKDNRRITFPDGVFGFNSIVDAKDTVDAFISSGLGELLPVNAHQEYTIPGGENYRELLLTLPDYYRSYIGSHYSSRNILAHVRVTDRQDMFGQKILFIEELQSDWHAEGRNYGFLNKSTDHRAVPEAPFAKSCYELVLKVMFYYAAKESYDGVCWTTGRLQCLRYENELNGLNTLYDKIIPDHVNRIIRQWDMTLSKVDLPICYFGQMSIEGEDDEWFVLDERNNSIRGPFDSDDSASQAMYELSTNNSMMEAPVAWISKHREQILSSPIPLFGLPAVNSQYTEPIEDHKKHEHMLDIQIAGFQFHGGQKFWDKLHDGDTLNLKREPNNRYDDGAIAIFWRKNKLGYVPRFQNEELARMMDVGCDLSAKIKTPEFVS